MYKKYYKSLSLPLIYSSNFYNLYNNSTIIIINNINFYTYFIVFIIQVIIINFYTQHKVSSNDIKTVSMLFILKLNLHLNLTIINLKLIHIQIIYKCFNKLNLFSLIRKTRNLFLLFIYIFIHNSVFRLDIRNISQNIFRDYWLVLSFNNRCEEIF